MSVLNGVMMQCFHWYSPNNGNFWNDLGGRARELADAGFTALWLPPAYKGLGGASDVGYGVYDMYDLGEFDQKGSIRTKYGTRNEYLAAIKELQSAGIQCYLDAVLNHRIGADEAETARATPYLQNNRLFPCGDSREIRSYTRFTFPGRGKTHSSFQWSRLHFDAVDYDDITRESGLIYLFDGKRFDDDVALENGNFAYLMGCDIDFQDPEVQEELTSWGKWYLQTTGGDGFRLDALKHISAWFFPKWLDDIEKGVGKDLFIVGEYWSPDISVLHRYLNVMGDRMSVFDVPLHYNFAAAGKAGSNYDLRRILDNTLMKERPTQAVTFVENHDSQPLQALESVVEPWFKPLAYAIILLRAEGYPSVFSADYDGASYEDHGRDGNSYRIEMPSHRRIIDIMLSARRQFAYGPQYSYLDHPNCIGWTRLGDTEHPDPLAVLISNGGDGWKWMDIARPNTQFHDATGNITETVSTNEYGWGKFLCKAGSVSIWTKI